MTTFFRRGTVFALCVLSITFWIEGDLQTGVIPLVGAAIISAIDDVIDSLDRAGRKTDV